FEAVFFVRCALRRFLIGMRFLRVVLLVCFFLHFFLAAIGAVYQLSAIVSAGAATVDEICTARIHRANVARWRRGGLCHQGKDRTRLISPAGRGGRERWLSSCR